MDIKNILVSQPAPAVPEKAPFFEVSKRLAFDVTYHPFIKVQGVSLKEFRSQRVEILEYSAVIFTSRNTVDNFFRIAEEARITIPEGMKYFCNTEAVALYLQKYIVYRKRKIFFADGQFNNFMELILKHKEERFVLALAEPHNPEIPLTLTKLKVDFASVIFSRTVAADVSDINMADYQIVAFYSPSEIASLVQNFGVDKLPMVVTFGESTTKAAAEAGTKVYGMAPSPAAPSMVKAVELLIKEIGEGKQVAPIEFSVSRKAEEFIKAQEAKPVKKSRAKRKPTAAKPAAKPAATAKKPAAK